MIRFLRLSKKKSFARSIAFFALSVFAHCATAEAQDLTKKESPFAEEVEVAVTLGARSENADAGQTRLTVQGKTNLQGGALAMVPFSSRFSLRTGLIYSVKRMTLSDPDGVNLDNNFSYLDVPAGIMVKAGDLGAFYVGPVFSVALSKNGSLSATPSATSPLNSVVDSAGAPKDVSAFNAGYSAGFQFKFYPQLGGNLYFESFSSLSAGIKNTRSVGFDLIVYFE